MIARYTIGWEYPLGISLKDALESYHKTPQKTSPPGGHSAAMSAGKAPLSAAEFKIIMHERMPFAALMGFELDSLCRERAVMRAVHREAFLRPGGTVAGPIMMGLADAAFYAVILGNIGAVELAVTTNLSINFLRKPPPGDILATARVLKLGKRLAVCEAGLHSEALGAEQPVAHATGTYSIPETSSPR